MKNDTLTDISFNSLDLDPSLKQGLQEAGFEFCTPIQAKSLPLALKGQDVAGQAQTGTGKTIAFLLALMHRLLQKEKTDKSHHPRAIVLAPTRELAIQIHKDAVLIGKQTGLKLGLVYGGAGYIEQREELAQGVDILIGTPGRIIDYFKQKVFNLHQIEVMVLDEADRMFDLGFIKDIRFLLNRMPKPEKRLSMLFSATLSHKVNELAYDQMNLAQKIQIEPEKRIADKLSEVVFYPANNEKAPLLIHLMRQAGSLRSIVFINTRREGERVWGLLEANGFNTALLSGSVPQNKRMRLLAEFQAGKKQVLVATDVAARGLHIEDVSHVYNYDLPQDAEDYVHRIGRTARAGKAGEAISFACEDFAFSLPDIEKYIGHTIQVKSIREQDLAQDLKPAIRVKRYEGTYKGNASDKGRSSSRNSNNKQNNTQNKKPYSKHKKPQQKSTHSADNKNTPQKSKPQPHSSTPKNSRRRTSRQYGKGRPSTDTRKPQSPPSSPSSKKTVTPVTTKQPWWKKLFGAD